MGSISLLLAGALSGCAGAELGDAIDNGADGDGDTGVGGDSPAEGDLRDQLARATPFTIADGAGGSSAHVKAVAVSGGETAAVDLAIAGGIVTLSLDEQDRIRFHDLLVDSDDVTVSPTVVPPDGLVLTDLTMELAEPVSVQVGSTADGDEIAAGAELSINVKWAVEVDHGVVDLAPIRLPDLAFDLSLEADASGRLAAHLTASHPGLFWSWAGIFELHDLEL
ncbi:MAG TPA: hypothetical protein VKB80_00335, partial [Kofleriaceae bacterium]|nr:hypothetical protein [Kofleriaceae bacterium]